MKKQVKLCPIFHFPPHMIKNHNPGEGGGLFLRCIYPRSFSKSNVAYSWKMPQPMLSLENGVLNQSFIKFYQFIDSNKYSIQSKFFLKSIAKMGNMNVFLVWNIIVIYILQYIFFSFFPPIESSRITIPQSSFLTN